MHIHGRECFVHIHEWCVCRYVEGKWMCALLVCMKCKC